MADQKITAKERSIFTVEKVASATKWIVLSGTATYFLTELVRLVEGLSLPSWAVLLSNFTINILIYAIAKYIEGHNGN